MIQYWSLGTREQTVLRTRFGLRPLPAVVLVSSQKQGGICGPWIPDDGKIVTHTVSKAGKMTQKYWTSKVSQPKQNSSKERVISSMW